MSKDDYMNDKQLKTLLKGYSVSLDKAIDILESLKDKDTDIDRALEEIKRVTDNINFYMTTENK